MRRINPDELEKVVCNGRAALKSFWNYN